MVTEFLQSCHSLVLSCCHSFGLFIGSLFSSLPVPFPHNLCMFIYSLFSSLPVPFPNSFRLFIRSLISRLPVPFPNNSVLLFVLICLVSTLACPRLRLQPNPLVPQPRDSRTRPSPVSRTHYWITLDIIVCRLTTLDCVLFPEACHIKAYLFFFPEFRLPIGSCYLSITPTKSARDQIIIAPTVAYGNSDNHSVQLWGAEKQISEGTTCRTLRWMGDNNRRPCWVPLLSAQE